MAPRSCTPSARQQPQPPLDPAVIRLAKALARAQAKEDHDREAAAQAAQNRPVHP